MVRTTSKSSRTSTGPSSRSSTGPSSRPSSRQSSRAVSPAPETATVQVAVRLRPINDREKKHGTVPVVTASSQDKTITVVKGQGNRQARTSYVFDNVFSAFTSQEEIFEVTLCPILGDVMQGFESTVFAYGQTGTGKTHTMEGDLSSPELHGVIPRSAQSIFTTLSQPEYNSHVVTCSYLEIYNEELCDLFADDEQRRLTKVEIMEGKEGIFCRGQTEKEVHSAEDVLSLMRKAQQFRKIGETKMNKQSSRSHCIFTLKINAKRVLDGGTLEIHGKLHLVDLAGSECAKSASGGGTAAKRDRERSNINKSLLTLGRVIIMLKEQSESKKQTHMRIPYRDSKLTRLLQKSLGGKCKTVVIATLSPSISSIEESLSTLNYAQSANGIINKPVATSYLSVNPTTMGINTVRSGEDSTSGQTLEHWYEMECKLQYMQTQVEEAQAAMARNYKIQQEIEANAEEEKRLFAKMEQKYEDAKEQIRSLEQDVVEEKKQKADITLELRQTETQLKETTETLEATQKYLDELEQKYKEAQEQIHDLKQDVAEEKKQKAAITLELRQTETKLKETTQILEATRKTVAELEQKNKECKEQIHSLEQDVAEEKRQKAAITLVLRQTETQLKETTQILEATQKTEVRLTAEATALIKTVQDSISDGKQLHQCLLDARESETQRRLATRKFHSITVTVLEDIVATLNSLSKKEEEYCDTTIDSAEKVNKISHQSLDQSLEVMKEITSQVALLTSTIKSHAQDEKGIMPLISKISEDVQCEIGQSKDILMDGEGQLSTSFQTGHRQLKEYSSKLKYMDSEYATLTENLMTSLDNNFSQSKDKMLSMVASITSALSAVRNANAETRNALDIVISKLEKDSIEAATHIEDVSKNQSVMMASGIESFSNGMQHVENMKMQLKEQVRFVGTEGSAHLDDIKTQNSMLSNQQESFTKAKKEQKILKDEFLATVLNGVTRLVNEQMGLLEKKQAEHLNSFEKNNQVIIEKNSIIGTSADEILGEVKGVNQIMLEHVEEVDKNNLDMKAIAEDAKATFVDIQDTSKEQQDTLTSHVSKANTRMIELSAQDESVAKISNEMQTERDVLVEQDYKMMQDEQNEVAIITDAAKQQSDYTSNTVIASVLANLVNMEKPRKQLITNISDKLDYVANTVKDGKVQIEVISNTQCDTADTLRREVELKQKEHNNNLGKRCRDEFDACKNLIATNARGHMNVSTLGLSSSTMNISSTKINIEDFASNTIQYKESVPPVSKRRSFSYSLSLSATPSADSIVKSLKCLK